MQAGHTSSLMGRHLFGEGGLIDAPLMDADEALQVLLEGHLATITHRFASCCGRAAPDVRAVLAIQYETCLQGLCADDRAR